MGAYPFVVGASALKRPLQTYQNLVDIPLVALVLQPLTVPNLTANCYSSFSQLLPGHLVGYLS